MPYYPPRPEQQPDEPEQNPGRQESEQHTRFDSRIFRYGMVFVCLFLIVYGLVQLGGYAADLFASRRTAQELKEAMEAPEEAAGTQSADPVPAVTPSPAPALTASPVPAAEATAAPAETSAPSNSSVLPAVEYPGGLKVVSRIQKLRKKSEYIIGWLTMDDTDEPVALKDNDFFLDHDATGRRNVNGAIFMDETTKLMTRPYTILLYGHNMKTGAMFGNLRHYTDAAYCHQHRFFRFDTLYEEGQYAIFAASTVCLTPGTARYFSIEALESADRETRRKALDDLLSLSAHKDIVDVNEEDQLVCLS